MAVEEESSGVVGRHGPVDPCKPSMDQPQQVTDLLATNALLEARFRPPFLGPRHHIQAWRDIGADPIILRVIEQGVQIPIHKLPRGSKTPIASNSLQETLQEYYQLGVLRTLSPQEQAKTKVWVHTFGRPKASSGALRMITNLRPLNQCFDNPHFKADHWGTVVETLGAWPLHTWGITLDLRHWFFHLGLHPQAQRWVRVQTATTAYQFLGLPFGLSCSPFWTTRLAKIIISHLRDRGLILVWYVDDLLILNTSPTLVLQDLTAVITLLNNLGVQLNQPKCNFVPSNVVKYLGQQIDLLHKIVSPLPTKLTSCLHLCKAMSTGKQVQPSRVAALAGTLLDLAKGAVNLSGLPKILMQIAGTMAQKGWYAFQAKSKLLHGLLHQARLELQQVQPLLLPTVLQTVKVHLMTDACDYGWGGTLQVESAGSWGTRHQAHQLFTPQEMERHITWKETMASTRCLQALWQHVPQGSHLHITSDATCCVATWNKGSNKPHLNEAVRKMKCLLAKQHCTASATHLPGVSNVVADHLSRLESGRNNHTIKLEVLQTAWATLGVRPLIDMFAADHNHRLPQFWSWGPSPFALAQDAFSQSWSHCLMYANPPWALIPRMLAKTQMDCAHLVVCIPLWKGAAWWPYAMSMRTGPLILLPQDLYLDHWGYPLPPLPWRTCMTVLRG